MAVKNTAQVIIGGKIITLGGYESEEYFQQVASYMNKKIGELETVPGYGRQPMETKHMLLSLNITDDYFKACLLYTSPPRGIFCPNSVVVARYGAFIVTYILQKTFFKHALLCYDILIGFSRNVFIFQ